jgi:hypothetical protein
LVVQKKKRIQFELEIKNKKRIQYELAEEADS